VQDVKRLYVKIAQLQAAICHDYANSVLYLPKEERGRNELREDYKFSRSQFRIVGSLWRRRRTGGDICPRSYIGSSGHKSPRCDRSRTSQRNDGTRV